MLKKRFTVAAIVTVIAAIAGIVSGLHYTNAAAGVVRAEPPLGADTPKPPAWAELHVGYLIAEADSKHYGFLPANFAKVINARGLATVDEAVNLGKTTGIDILIISKGSLKGIDPQWAARQYRSGTAFVGLNITAQELGKLIDDPSFANEWGDQRFPEPFVSKAMIKVSGDPKQIEAAWKAGLVAPEHDVDLVKAGFDQVFMTTVRGYGPLVSDDGSLIPDLNDIRYNLNSQNLVTP